MTEVTSIIKQLSSGKASGPNSIPTDILHLLMHDISKPLTQFFNLSFKLGKHPDMFKIARVMPVFKKGSRLLVGNYRPISLLSNLNKILEKLMFNVFIISSKETIQFTNCNLDFALSIQQNLP